MVGFHSIVSRGLFAPDYLLNRLPKRHDWRHSANERELLEQVRGIFEQAGPLIDTGNEAQIRTEIVDKVLALVNPHSLPGQSLPTGIEADYVFFPDLKSKQLKDLVRAIAVGEAKPPRTDFDKSQGGRSPVRQTYDYMVDAQTDWGILTDGRRWRLLHRISRTDKCCEIDLHDIASRDDREEWLYFYNLFRREAFTVDEGKSLLDQIREESNTYEQLVGDELKDRVYLALRDLAQGFVNWPENRLNPQTEEVRQHIRGACFILLYRLLFILYAEALNLLPLDRAGYRQMSLQVLRSKVRGAAKDDAKFLDDSRQILGALRDLFRLVDQGSPSLGISPYNGGLFSRTAASLPHADFLERYEIADKYLARAIDLLGTAPSIEDKTEVANVDYAGLEIRHLGSIYEGLLEFRLALAETDLVSVKDGREEIWIPASEYKRKKPLKKLPPERKVRRGELYLETSRHERRATGSYYTSEPIVKYIVDRTVSPMIKERRELAKQRGISAAEEILRIRVCDPAMGSGHFLVEAIQVLAEAVMGALEEDQEKGLVQKGEYDIAWAKREVARRCVYGVDMNDLAVELAKVSLWLATVSQEKPLSFLDHRLKTGNSLLGTDLASLKRYPNPKKRPKAEDGGSLPDFVSRIFIEKLIRKIKDLEAIGDNRLEDVKRKERIFAEFRLLPEYQKAKAVADVWTSLFFGNEIAATEKKDAKDVYYDLIYSLDYPDNWEPKTKTSWFKRAAQIATEKRLFHWELEFPEVFLAHEGDESNRGFDAIVGNPPYVNALQLAKTGDPQEKEFIRLRFVAQGAFDLYIPFLELGQRLVRPNGRSGLITPNKLLAAPYAESFRRRFAHRHTLELVLDASQAEVFEDPAVYPIVTIFVNREPLDEDTVSVEYLSRGEDKPRPRGGFPQSLLSIFPEYLWGFLLSKDVGLITRLATQCKPLDPHMAKVQASTTAAESELFGNIMSECPGHTDSEHFRVVNTGVIDPYENLWGLQPLVHVGRKLQRPCVARDEGQLSPMRRDLFRQPKLIVAKVALDPEVCMDTVGDCAGVNVNFVFNSRVDLRFLLALLGSRLMAQVYRDYFGALTMQNAYAQFQAPQLRILPTPVINMTTPENRKQDLLARAFGLPVLPRVLKEVQTQELVPTWKASDMKVLAGHPDVMLDALSFLAGIKSSEHKRKLLLVSEFLNWTQSPAGLGLDLDKMTNGNRFREFVDDPHLGTNDGRVALETVLSQNGILLKPGRLRAFAEQYSKVSSALAHVLLRIEKLRVLIDALVYRLYGLTAAEISAIEAVTLGEVEKRYAWND